MKLRQHGALKDPRMKYARAANRLLDTGMLLLIAGAIGSFASVLGMLPGGAYFFWSMAAFGAGGVLLVAAKIVAGVQKESAGHADDGSRKLRLVK